MESFEISATFPVTAEVIYKAWLSSSQHGEMTGTGALIDPKVNGLFSIWDGYITGRTVELIENKKIIQQWRSMDFPEGSDHSVLEVHLKGIPAGTRLKLKHFNIPDGQGEEYRQGWKDYYFRPMKRYFNK